MEYSICWQVYTLHRCMHLLKLIKLYTLYVVLYVNYISIKGVDKSSPSWCEVEIQRESIYDLDAGRCWRCLSPALFTVFSFSYPKNVQRGIWASQLWCPGDELRETQRLELPVCGAGKSHWELPNAFLRLPPGSIQGGLGHSRTELMDLETWSWVGGSQLWMLSIVASSNWHRHNVNNPLFETTAREKGAGEKACDDRL